MCDGFVCECVVLYGLVCVVGFYVGLYVFEMDVVVFVVVEGVVWCCVG